MAQFATDFTNVNINEFTNRWASSTNSIETVEGATGGKVLRIVKTAASRHATSWDTAGTSLNQQIFARLRHNLNRPPQGAGLNVNWISLRVGGSPGEEQGLAAGLWFNSFGPLSADNERLRGLNYSSGMSSTPYDVATPKNAILKDQWINVLCDFQGNTFRKKIWLEGQAEPSTWLVETTIAEVPSGFAAIGGFAIGTYEYDFLGVGTDGDSAPRELISGGADVELPPASTNSVANNPTVSAGASVSVPTAAANAELYSPMVTTAAGVELPTAFADSQSFNIEIAGGAEISLPAASSSSLLYPIDASTGAGVLLPAALAQSMAYNQHIASGAAVFVDTAYAEADALDLSVSTGEAQRFVKIVHLAGTYRRLIRL